MLRMIIFLKLNNYAEIAFVSGFRKKNVIMIIFCSLAQATKFETFKLAHKSGEKRNNFAQSLQIQGGPKLETFEPSRPPG